VLVNQIINKVFFSNTYVLIEKQKENVWLIDIGDVDSVINFLPEHAVVQGLFITHPHFDHIYGINKLISLYPDCKVFASALGREGLFSAKKNLSFYQDEPVVFSGSKVVILQEGFLVELGSGLFLEPYETPGHDWSCLTYKVGDYLFTGDSYIPGIEVVTKLKGGNQEANIESLFKIRSLISSDTVICPGHGSMLQPG
jgi:hydroxyacylglutathione hydrolase